MRPVDDPRIDEWLHAYAAREEDPVRIEAFVTRMDGAILARVPALAADAILIEDLHASTRSHWVSFLKVVADPSAPLLVTPEAVTFAVALAGRGLELGVLLKTYRVAQQVMWEITTELVEDLPPGSPEPTPLLVRLWTHVGRWIDHSVEHLIPHYHAERARIARGAMSRRIETVRAVLEGRATDAEQLTTELGHPMAMVHTAFVVWVDDSELVGELERASGKVAALMHGSRPLVVSRGTRDVWCWTATRRPPVLQELDRNVPMLGSARVRLAVGTPAPGVDGFRTSHEEAIAAQRLALAAAHSPRLVRYSDVELISLMAADPVGAERFVARVLGGLAGDAKGMDRLRQTLFAWLTSGGELDELASAMMVHRNTVRYRVRQAEEVLGYRVSERRADLEVALRHLAALGRL